MIRLALCQGCLDKQREIDALRDDNQRLRAQLRHQARKATEGLFGSSTPSSKLPVKANTLPERQARKGGARCGHVGHGRPTIPEATADRVETVPWPTPVCPDCGGPLETWGVARRTVIEAPPIPPEARCYRVPIKYCHRCRRTVRAPVPGVLPKSLYGNQLLTNVATEHYVHGIPLGRQEEQLGIGVGSLLYALDRLARLFAPVTDRLLQEYRLAPVKHADETGWRTDGQNGYAWDFCTATLSLFRFRQTRSAAVPQEVFGPKRLRGVLVVDRYNAYNKAPCAMQYCYSHLLREVQDLAKAFPEDDEVRAFTQTFAPLLAKAIRLRTSPSSGAVFTRRARRLKARIRQVAHAPARHPGIQRLQDIWREHPTRLYHWARDRTVPADNNLAERDLRPLVIARKVSFGSQSAAGAKTRETLMTVLWTLRKRFPEDYDERFKRALDRLAADPRCPVYDALFQQPQAPP